MTPVTDFMIDAQLLISIRSSGVRMSAWLSNTIVEHISGQTVASVLIEQAYCVCCLGPEHWTRRLFSHGKAWQCPERPCKEIQSSQAWEGGAPRLLALGGANARRCSEPRHAEIRKACLAIAIQGPMTSRLTTTRVIWWRSTWTGASLTISCIWATTWWPFSMRLGSRSRRYPSSKLYVMIAPSYLKDEI